MNSRYEGEYLAPDKEMVLKTLNEWVEEGDIELEEPNAEKKEDRISYWADDGITLQEFHHIFTETDTVERIKADIIYDEKVTDYIDIDKLAEFVYNCIDVNSLAVVNKLVLLYDEEDTYNTKARKEMVELTGDEYGYEVGDGDLLGVNWVERSMVIIRVDKLLEESKKCAEQKAYDLYIDCEDGEWKEFFEDIFREGLIQTLCHEYRHSVFELNYFIGDDKNDVLIKGYPRTECKEENVEQYGNDTAYDILHNPKAEGYLKGLIQPDIVAKYEKDLSEKEIEEPER